MKEISDILREFEKRQDEPLALATLVRATGSSYRRPGARMLIGLSGPTAGSLSGGCVEEEVASLAQNVISAGEPKLIAFDMRRRFGCNGAIEIFIEPLRESFLSELSQHFRGRRSCLAATNFETEGHELGTIMVRATDECIAGAFVERIEPPIQLLVVGAGPEANSFRQLSELLGWDFVSVPSPSLLGDEFDERTAVVVKTHNYGRDFCALQKLLPLGLRYLGLIGPRKRRGQLLADLFNSSGALGGEFFAPAGLDLGTETPQEIALAIVAEIQSVFNAGSGKSLRDRRAPIHAIRCAPAETEAVAAAR